MDFEGLVLHPATNVFAITIRVTPLVTQPGAPPYDARGVYSSSPVDVMMGNDTIFSDQATKLGIRLKEFAVPPDRGDLIEMTDPTHWTFGTKYWVGDSDMDGQGGCDLLLRTQQDTPSL